MKLRALILLLNVVVWGGLALFAIVLGWYVPEWIDHFGFYAVAAAVIIVVLALTLFGNWIDKPGPREPR